jgi:hypothetical protein
MKPTMRSTYHLATKFWACLLASFLASLPIQSNSQSAKPAEKPTALQISIDEQRQKKRELLDSLRRYIDNDFPNPTALGPALGINIEKHDRENGPNSKTTHVGKRSSGLVGWVHVWEQRNPTDGITKNAILVVFQEGMDRPTHEGDIGFRECIFPTEILRAFADSAWTNEDRKISPSHTYKTRFLVRPSYSPQFPRIQVSHSLTACVSSLMIVSNDKE